MKIIIFILLTGCTTLPSAHDAMYSCRDMCGEKEVWKYTPRNGECICKFRREIK